MKFLQVLSLVLVYVFESSVAEMDGFEVKYAQTGGYWTMPLNKQQLEKYPKFQFVGKDADLNVDLYSETDDPRFFLMFDNNGNIAGIRTGYIKADTELKAKANNLTFPYNFEAIPMFKKGTFWKKEIYYTSILFVSPEKLKSGGRKDTLGKVAEGVYAFLDGKWLDISKDECKIEKQGFTKQACFPGMGQHYYYKLTPSLNCKEYQPFFPIYEFGRLVAFGLCPFGSFTSTNGKEWFEQFPKAAAEKIMPTGPKCAYDWYEKFGSSCLHTFLKKDARKIACPKDNALKC